jgi:Zn-finger nucleic acid-binding protein/rubrerythrin
MFCKVCGNTVEPLDDGRCPVCEANRERGSLVPEERPRGERRRGRGGREDGPRLILCPECGNQVDADRECPVCANSRERRKARKQLDETQFCRSCGNTFHGTGPCPICNAGRAIRKHKRALCPGCGNEVDDAAHCPVCEAGRAAKRKRKEGAGPSCPQCELPLLEQDWDGTKAHLCEQCNGVFFPGDGLELVLDHLRSGAAPDADSRVEVFRRLLRRPLPPAVRYKACPLCAVSMTRRSYAGSSGIVIDVCPGHGTWIEQSAFGDLTDYVTSGADTNRAKRFGGRRS